MSRNGTAPLQACAWGHGVHQHCRCRVKAGEQHACAPCRHCWRSGEAETHLTAEGFAVHGNGCGSGRGVTTLD